MSREKSDPFGNKQMERLKSLLVPEGFKEVSPDGRLAGTLLPGEFSIGAPFSRIFRKKEG